MVYTNVLVCWEFNFDVRNDFWDFGCGEKWILKWLILGNIVPIPIKGYTQNQLSRIKSIVRSAGQQEIKVTPLPKKLNI